MDEQKPRKRPTTIFSRSARNLRILQRLREGLGYDEVARKEGLTERRVRQIAGEGWRGRAALRSGGRPEDEIDRLRQVVLDMGDVLSILGMLLIRASRPPRRILH